MSKISDDVRKAFKETDDLRDLGLTTPDSIVRYDDICYGEDAKWQSLDVYRPKNAGDKKLPVIVSVHGGAWVYGDKERYSFYCMDLATRGFAVVNFTYRLAPEFQFPASLEDTNSVFKWVFAHASEYGFDTENVFAVGDSAGAHILGLYSAFCTNKDYTKLFSFKPLEGFKPKAIVLNCGAFKLELSDDPEDMNTGLMHDLMPNHGTEEEMELINVSSKVNSDFPPCFIVTATGDFLIDQPALMIDKFIKYSVPHEFHFYGDKDNELGHVFMLRIREDAAKICNDEECDFFRKFMTFC